MKKPFYIIAVILFSFLSLPAQNTDGKEFWLTFGEDRNIPCCQSLFKVFQIRIVGGNKPTTGIIYFTHLNDSISFEINAYEIYNYTLTNDQKEAAYNFETGTTDHSIHITSNEQVSVYAYHASSPTSYRDATNILPVTALGKEYYQISYTATNYEDAYAIVATQNNTQIYHDGFPVAMLNAGQVYYRTSTDDMTGVLITSSHPVAFFALHKGAHIPSETSVDKHLMQQLAPINTWDKTFFVPVTVLNQNFVRIVASQNNTSITECDGTLRTGVPGAQTTLNNLQAGEFVELEIDNHGCYIVADKPVGVCTYMTQRFYYPLVALPAQAWVPGIKQTVSKALIAPFSSPNIEHFALIVTPTNTSNSAKVSMGGEPFTDLDGGIWNDHAIAGMSFYNMPLNNDTASYIFTNLEGITIFVYGVGTASYGYPTSYYYLAYSAMRNLEVAFYANDIHYQTLNAQTICDANIFNFRAEVEGLHPDAGSLIWLINGTEEPGTQDQLTWSKTFPNGKYTVGMQVRYANDEMKTISSTFIIYVGGFIKLRNIRH